MKHKKKLLILGLDGVSWNILKSFLARGCMDNFKRIIDQGYSGELRSTEPPITPCAWTSFQTGVPPEQHGIVGFRKLVFDRENKRVGTCLLDSTCIKLPKFWDVLSSRSIKCCCVNLPFTYPPFAINGCLVSGFPVPSADSEYTFPAELKKDILRNIPDYEPTVYDVANITVKNVRTYVSKMEKMLKSKEDLCDYLLSLADWDIFMVQFQETDLIQHPFWHLIHDDSRYYNKSDAEVIEGFYRELDRIIGKYCDFWPGDVVLLSDHGFQEGWLEFNLNAFLVNEGYLRLRKSSYAIRLENYVRVIKKGYPALSKLINRIISAPKRIQRNISILDRLYDFANSFCYGNCASQNSAYIEVLNDFDKSILESKLFKLRYRDKEVVKDIKQISKDRIKIELHRGIVCPIDTTLHKRVFSRKKVGKQYQIGVHDVKGIIVIRNRGSKNTNKLTLSYDITDVAPTIISYFGLPVPTYMAGNIIKELTPGAKETLHYNIKSKQSKTSSADEGAIIEQLRSLGYM